MSMEKMVRAVAYLRKSGGYNLVVTPCVQGGFVVTGGFKDPGAYGFTVGFAASADILEEAQAACISGLANLCKLTEDSKPAIQQKPASTYQKPANGFSSAPSAGVSGAIVSLKGLKDEAWQKGKAIIKEAGFKYDTDSKEWSGGNVAALPEWLQKRVKGMAPTQPIPTTSKPYSPPAEEEGDYEQTAAIKPNMEEMPF